MAKANKKKSAISANKSVLLWHPKYFYEWLIILFSFCLFANSVVNDYNLDDELVTINHRLTSKGISAIPDIFTSPYYQDESGYSYEYRPVVLASFAIEHQFFGDNAHVSHFFNVLIYALCCVVLYKILLLLFIKKSSLIALGITLLFIAHPAHTEVVCSIKNRDEMLGFLFGLLALYAAVKGVKASPAWSILLVFLFFTLALMSKATIVSFAFIIPLALILFSDAGIFYLIAITLALAIPAYFLLTLSGGFEKLVISVLILITMFVFYLVANNTSFLKSFQVAVSRIKLLIRTAHARLIQTNSESNSGMAYFNYKHFFKQIMPDKRIWSLYPVLITAAFASSYMLCIWGNYSLLAFIPVSVLLILAWRGEERIAWWAAVMIGACLLLDVAVIDFRAGSKTHDYLIESNIFAQIICIYFAYQMYYGRQGLFIPLLICYLTANFINISVCRNWEGIGAVCIVILNFKYARLIMALVRSWATINLIITTYTILELLREVTWFAILLSIHFNKGKKIIPQAIALLLFISFHFNQAKFDKRIQNPVSTIITVSNQINPKIISTPQYRPLSYMEECVSSNTPFSIKAGTSFEILFHYLHKVILPYPMSFYYGYRFIYPQKITDPLPLLSLIIHLILLLSAFMLLRRETLFAFGIFIYLMSIVIFSNYFQTVPGMLADRFLLIPSLGWVIVLVVILQKLFKLKKDLSAGSWSMLPATAKYSFTAILLFYSSITFSRNFDWKDDLNLFRHDINYVSQSAQAHNLLALHIMKTVQTISDPAQKTEMEKEALHHFKIAEEIYPHFFNIPYDIGRVYASLSMPDSAIAAFKRSLTLDTVFPDVYWNLGVLLVAQGKFDEAKPYFESLIRLKPYDYSGYERLSYVYFKMNQYDKSIEVNLKAVQQFPNIPDPLINLAKTYIANSQPDSARLFLDKANKMSPGNVFVQQMFQEIGR